MRNQPSERLEAGLYVVATPIGNLSDLGQRARDILIQVAVVAAEDTRVSRTLLEAIGAKVPMIAAHEHNEQSAATQIIERVQAGEAVALISDAGTPGVSDPGSRIVRALRAAALPIFAVPGPSAAAALVSIAGLYAERFCFVGFLPPKVGARDAMIAQWLDCELAQIVFESPRRVASTIAAIVRILGPERRIVIGRELSKRFEESIALPAGEAEQWLNADPHRGKGEFVLAIDRPESVTPDAHEAVSIAMPLDALLQALLEHLPPSRASRLAQHLTGRARRGLYERLLALHDAAENGPDAN